MSHTIALVLFLAVGTGAALGTAGIAIAVGTQALPPLPGILAAGALAAWSWAMARLIRIAADHDAKTTPAARQDEQP